MDAKEYIKELKRMLDSCGRTDGYCNGINCNKCPLRQRKRDCCDIDKSVDIVEKWSKEHPKKTYLDVLLEAFPNTPMSSYGVPSHVCPRNLGLRNPKSCTNISCIDCWGREYKEAD